MTGSGIGLSPASQRRTVRSSRNSTSRAKRRAERPDASMRLRSRSASVGTRVSDPSRCVALSVGLPLVLLHDMVALPNLVILEAVELDAAAGLVQRVVNPVVRVLRPIDDTEVARPGDPVQPGGSDGRCSRLRLAARQGSPPGRESRRPTPARSPCRPFPRRAASSPDTHERVRRSDRRPPAPRRPQSQNR
jgi:hypothetical protein